MRHGRIPWPTVDELDAEQRAVRHAITAGPRASIAPAFSLTDDEGRLHGPFNAMLLAPRVGLPLQELGGALRHRGSLTDRERETAILQVAATRRCEFEWYAHERVGARAGLTGDELDSLSRGEAPATLAPDEALVHRSVRALLDRRDLDDDEYAAAEALGTDKLAELVILVGYYDSLSLLLGVFRTPLPPDGGPGSTSRGPRRAERGRRPASGQDATSPRLEAGSALGGTDGPRHVHVGVARDGRRDLVGEQRPQAGLEVIVPRAGATVVALEIGREALVGELDAGAVTPALPLGLEVDHDPGAEPVGDLVLVP